MSRLQITPIEGAPFGALVFGAPPWVELTIGDVRAIQAALDRHLLVVLRGQSSPSDEALLAFATNFGRVPRTGLNEGARSHHNEILLISNVVEDGRQIGVGDAGFLDWHTDYSFRDEVSQTGFLEAIELPVAGGGETMFISTYAVHDSLPESLRVSLNSCTARHAMRSRYDDVSQSGAAAATHPVIARNPRTGRRCVYVNPLNTKSLHDSAGRPDDALLAELFAKITSSQASVVHDWLEGDLVIWDEIGLVHARRPFNPGSRRIMRQLVTVFDDAALPWRGIGVAGARTAALDTSSRRN
jgi:taurine dioxygenase/pentalenolactone F synthase